MDPPNPVLPAPGRPVPPRDHTRQLTSSVEAGPAESHFLETKLEELSPFAHQGTLEQVTPDPLLASGGGFIPQPGYTHRVTPPQADFRAGERGWRETRGSVPSRRLMFSPSGFQPQPRSTPVHLELAPQVRQASDSSSVRGGDKAVRIRLRENEAGAPGKCSEALVVGLLFLLLPWWGAPGWPRARAVGNSVGVFRVLSLCF